MSQDGVARGGSRRGVWEADVGLPRSRYPLEAWLAAAARGRTPGGIDTPIRRVSDGALVEVSRPKEPVPFFVHAVVEISGRAPEFVAVTRTGRVEVRERYRFRAPSVFFVYAWTEDGFTELASRETVRWNVLYVCADEAQIARAAEVVAAISPPGPPRPRGRLLSSPQRPAGPPRNA